MAKYKIEISDECIQCGACAAACEENFEMKDGKAKVKKPNVDSLGCSKDAAEGCPVNAIHITDTKTKKRVI